MTELRDTELRVANSQICLFTNRRIRKNVVVCPYLGKLCLVDPIERYTVKLKTKDIKNRQVYLAADAVGGNGRFINHLCYANCRIEELNGEFGPEIAIVAGRDIQPGEEVTVDYGPDKNFYCYCGSHNCRDKDRHDSL
ncbi:DNA-binding transcription repressor [Phytophthora pseudosyringae]|uniref:DNA-binding transcription repressor n=1 Tax=Phytophthora pseudosyringae TaxID=221518 RepID=A0A8T1V7M9_9STRA|nr:DNA-binding transcription repressor [Phytophthora pseudosyringae]